MRILIPLLLALTPTSLFTQDQSMMRAVQLKRFGGPEVLQVQVVARPIIGKGELLVRVNAAGVNPVDASTRANGTRAKIPYIPGFDISGVVTEIGSGVTKFEPGDEVFAMLSLYRGGGYAEFAIVKESEAAQKPFRLSHDQAASMPLVALTAWQALIEVADLSAGQTVLIHAGAGGVGSIAIQIAKWRGAKVITTASSKNHEFLRGLRADIVVDYRNQRFEDYAFDVDVVLDAIGHKTQDRSISVLKAGGRLVSLVGLTKKGKNPGRNIQATAIKVRPDSKQLTIIGKLIEDGLINPIVNYRFPLEKAAEAHKQIETRHTRGKIVIEIADSLSF